MADGALAWLFYTSGTTGRPKGATITNRNLLTMSLSYFADIDAITSNDCVLHAAPISHGSGLYGMLLFAIVSVFVAGLMVGRTPEYLGKKIEAREVKMAMLAILVLPLSILAVPLLDLLLAAKLVDLNNLRVAVENEEKLRWELVAAQARVEIWRSQEATNRTAEKLFK